MKKIVLLLLISLTVPVTAQVFDCCPTVNQISENEKKEWKKDGDSGASKKDEKWKKDGDSGASKKDKK